MKIFNNKEKIWAEKYRPQTLEDIIIDSETRNIASEWIKENNLPNLGLFSYTPGTGKTSFAKLLANEVNGDLVHINASKENGVDVIRNKVMRFASSNSIFGGQRIVLLDEADGLTPSSQESLRGFIEEFSQNCRFIITANYSNRIIEPLCNRLNCLDFDAIFNTHKKEIAAQVLERAKFVLNNEQVTYDEDTLKAIIKKFYPSTRQVLITLQGYTNNKELKCDVSLLTNVTQYTSLVEALKSRKFDICRKEILKMWDAKNFYTHMFNNVDSIFNQNDASIANAITIIHDFMTSFDRIKNPEISLSAFCASIIMHPGIKFSNEKINI